MFFMSIFGDLNKFFSKKNQLQKYSLKIYYPLFSAFLTIFWNVFKISIQIQQVKVENTPDSNQYSAANILFYP